MFRIYTLEELELIKKRLEELKNNNFYQSVANAKIRLYGNQNCMYYELVKDSSSSILGMTVIKNDCIELPFGPIIRGNITADDLKNYIMYIKKINKKSIIFSIEQNDSEKYSSLTSELEEIWAFSTLILDIDKDYNDILKGYNQNRRRILKKCYKLLNVSNIYQDKNLYDKFFDIYKKRLMITNGFLDLTLEQLKIILENDETNLYMYLDGTTPVSGMITFNCGNTVINRYNATDPNLLQLNANSFVENEVIKKLSADEKYSFYDMSGFNTDENNEKGNHINQYKLSYGPKLIKECRWYKL